MGDGPGDNTHCRSLEDKDEEEEEEGCDAEAWETLSRSFDQVQSVLDQNRLLIQQVNENQQSRIHDNLVKNVSLIREINGNFCKVISIYSKLSADFVDIVRRRRAENDGDEKKKEESVDLNLPLSR
ncbi:hypothetical protein PVL29_007643 [Vitis rotundifolia]|uniref:Protein EARLY FLOWERING 4 domain-containing protein n=1 Tax=Vitis rotundifolia TaxID=103349 RepID=A0AA39DX32_VITRO|nr:hypothetical protein PVL29_007643 [Vitis rotundifolia]